MNIHKNVRLTPVCRLEMLCNNVESSLGITETAALLGRLTLAGSIFVTVAKEALTSPRRGYKNDRSANQTT